MHSKLKYIMLFLHSNASTNINIQTTHKIHNPCMKHSEKVLKLKMKAFKIILHWVN